MITTQPIMCKNVIHPNEEVIKAICRQAMFSAKMLNSEDEIEAYVEKIRTNMKQ